MAKIYDISMMITNELPKLVITNDIVVTINNRKSTILNIQAMVQEGERSENPKSETEFMMDALKLLIGKKSTDELEALDLPIDEYKQVYNTIMSIATGEDPDTPSE